MSDGSIKRMIAAYIEREAAPTGFLAGFFQSPRQNFFSGESIEIDVQRNDPDIAVPVPNITVRGRMNEASQYSNKEFVPPVYKEEFQVSVYDFMKRQPGRNPFEAVDFMAEAGRQMMSGMSKLERKIRRALELQAGQVLQNGTVTLTDEAAATIYTIDFNPKSALFPNAGTSWASSTTKISDVTSLARAIYTNGKSRPEIAVFGRQALDWFLADADVKARLDVRRMDVGAISSPVIGGDGGIYHGHLSFGEFNLAIWSYDAFYKHPQTGVMTPYVDPDNVLVIAPGRRDLCFGDVPRIVDPDPRVAAMVLGRASNAAGGMDLISNAWVNPEGTAVHGSVSSRPLCVPTAIDTFGRLHTTP